MERKERYYQALVVPSVEKDGTKLLPTLRVILPTVANRNYLLWLDPEDGVEHLKVETIRELSWVERVSTHKTIVQNSTVPIPDGIYHQLCSATCKGEHARVEGEPRELLFKIFHEWWTLERLALVVPE